MSCCHIMFFYKSQPSVSFCNKRTPVIAEVNWFIFKRQLFLIITALNFPFHSSVPSSLDQCFHRPLRCPLSLLPVSRSWPVTARTTGRYSGSGLRETRLIRERVCFMVKIQNPLDLKKTQTLDLVLSVIFFFFLYRDFFS